MNFYIIIVTFSVAFSGCVILFFDTLTNFILYTKTFHTFYSVDYSLILYEVALGPEKNKNGWESYTSILLYIYGGIGGILLCWLLGNHISRKTHLIIGSLIIALSCFLLFFNITSSRYYYYSIHMMGGIGTAILRVVTPVYLAELATKSKRGMILSTFQSMKYLGRVFAFTLIIYLIHHDHQKYSMTDEDMRRQWDTDHDPKTFSSVTFAYPFILSNYSKNLLKFIKIFPCSFFLLLIFFFIPNSPRYLFYSRHYNKAFKILYRLYTPKKLVTISEEDLPETFFQQIYRYRQKMARLCRDRKRKQHQIFPITDEDEEKLAIYNSTIYSLKETYNEDETKTVNNNQNHLTKKKLTSSPPPNDQYYCIVDEEDQIDDFIDHMEKSKEAVKKAIKEKEEKVKLKKQIRGYYKKKETESENKKKGKEELIVKIEEDQKNKKGDQIENKNKNKKVKIEENQKNKKENPKEIENKNKKEGKEEKKVKIEEDQRNNKKNQKEIESKNKKEKKEETIIKIEEDRMNKKENQKEIENKDKKEEKEKKEKSHISKYKKESENVVIIKIEEDQKSKKENQKEIENKNKKEEKEKEEESHSKYKKESTNEMIIKKEENQKSKNENRKEIEGKDRNERKEEKEVNNISKHKKESTKEMIAKKEEDQKNEKENKRDKVQESEKNKNNNNKIKKKVLIKNIDEIKEEKIVKERTRRHRKVWSADPYLHSKIVKYKNDDSLDIIINPWYQQKPSVIYTTRKKASKLKIPDISKAQPLYSETLKLENQSISILHTVTKSSNNNSKSMEENSKEEESSKQNDLNCAEIMKRISSNQRVYSKTKKSLIPKDDNASSSVVINVETSENDNNELIVHPHNHRRYHTEPPVPSNLSENNTTTNNNNNNTTDQQNNNLADYLTIIVNRDVLKTKSGMKKDEKYETSKKTTNNDETKSRKQINIVNTNDMLGIRKRKPTEIKTTNKQNNDYTIITIKEEEEEEMIKKKENSNKNEDKNSKGKKDTKKIKSNKEKNEMKKGKQEEKREVLKEIKKEKQDEKKEIRKEKQDEKKETKKDKQDEKKEIKNEKAEVKKVESIIKTYSKDTHIMKISSSESLAYHQFKDFDFEPVISRHIINISEEIEKHREMSFFKFYWTLLKHRFALTILMNMTQQLIQYSIFVTYFNLLSDPILSNYLNIFYLFITEFLLYIPVNIYLSCRNRRVILYGGLICIVITYNILIFVMYRLHNFYVYFASVLVILYNSTWGCFPMIYQSEIFPTRARIIGSAIGCLVAQCCHLILFLCLPYTYQYRTLIFCLVIGFIVIFSIFGIFFMKDTNNVELEKIDIVFNRLLTPNKIKKKLIKLSSKKNLNPIKKVSFAIFNNHNRIESNKSYKKEKEKIIPI